MTNRVLDLADRPARLRVRNSLLVVRFSAETADEVADTGIAAWKEETYPCESLGDPSEVTIPFADIAVLVVSHPRVSYSHAVLAGLASAGGVFVSCNDRRMPVAMLLPLVGHSLQAERFAAQAAAPLPVKKRIWKQIVGAKIGAQARLLAERTGSDYGLPALATRVRSGDPENVEAQAARIYWSALFRSPGFRRDADGDGLNACLNYGYAILRAVTARALCAAGLHPCLGIHHHNRYDAFCLADDLMEPFRPVADREVAKLAEVRGPEAKPDKEAKRAVLRGLVGRFTAEGESRTLFDWINRAAFSLACGLEGRNRRIELPVLGLDSLPD